MNNINVNEILNLPLLDDISIDISYMQMPLSLFCKKLGISENDLFLIESCNLKEFK